MYFWIGDLINEDEVLNWLIEQKSTATIEEVTDEILKGLVEEHEYVLVYFSKWNETSILSTRLLNSFGHIKGNMTILKLKENVLIATTQCKKYNAYIYFVC